MPFKPFTAGQALSASALNAAFDVVRTKYQAADHAVNNSVTLVSSTDLVFDVDSNASYILEAQLMYDTNSSADVKHALVLPSGSTGLVTTWDSGTDTTSTSLSGIDRSVVDITNPFTWDSGGITGSIMSSRPGGLISIGNASGTVVYQFAQASADASDTTLKSGSWIRLTRVA